MSLVTNCARHVLCQMAAPLATRLPVRVWPAWLGDLYGIKVPTNLRRNETPSPAGSANINIVLDLIDEVSAIDGDLAECGVYRGATLVTTGLYLRQGEADRRVYGFDSFEGFDASVEFDLKLAGAEDGQKVTGGFADTSHELIQKKLALLGLAERVQLIKGYFRDTLPAAAETRYAFVHLDCDLYESYRDCLAYFYERMNPHGIILLDEYDDPPWPGCNLAVDEFLRGRSERLETIERNNYIKRFIRKASRGASTAHSPQPACQSRT
jgi:O-methyltransferase